MPNTYFLFNITLSTNDPLVLTLYYNLKLLCWSTSHCILCFTAVHVILFTELYICDLKFSSITYYWRIPSLYGVSWCRITICTACKSHCSTLHYSIAWSSRCECCDSWLICYIEVKLYYCQGRHTVTQLYSLYCRMYMYFACRYMNCI